MAFASIARADEDPNDTAQAIVEHFAGADAAVLHASRVVPFSSDKKWSGAVFDDGSVYVMGAASSSWATRLPRWPTSKTS